MLFLLLNIFRFIKAEEDAEQEEETLIKNISFAKDRDGVILRVFLSRESNPTTINIMESKERDDPNSYTVAATIEDEVSWLTQGTRFEYILDESLLKKPGVSFSVQIEEGKKLFHSEPFVYDSDTKNCILARNAKGRSDAGWIVALVLSAVALLICCILVFVKFCT